MSAQLLKTPGGSKPTFALKKPSKLNRYLGLLVLGFLTFAIFLRGRATLPLDRSTLTPFHVWLNNLSAWIDTNRNSNPIFTSFVNVIRGSINWFVTFLQNGISQTGDTRSIPQLGWLGVVAIIGFVVYAISNVKIAIFSIAGFVTLGLLGFWQESMDTLALTLAAVILSLLIGIPLGIFAGLYPRFEKLITPALDFAQVMPTFVYLTPRHSFLSDWASFGDDRHPDLRCASCTSNNFGCN